MNHVLLSTRDPISGFFVLSSKVQRVFFALLCGMATLGTTSLHALPYASGLTNNAGTISFRLNESAGNVKVVSDGGATVNDLGPLAAGLHTFPLGISGTFQVEVFKASPLGYAIPISANQGAILQISPNSITTRFNSPRGVAVNTDPTSPYFGRVYVANGGSGTTTSNVFGPARALGDGIYVMNSDLSDALGQGNAALNGGINFGTGGDVAPYRLTIGQDDNLYIADWSDSTGSLYVLDPNVVAGPLTNVLFGPTGSPFPVGATRYHGSIAAAVVEGSLAEGNLVAYVIDEDLQTDRASTSQSMRNTLWRHDIGAALPGPEVLPTRIGATTPWINFASQTMDLSRGTNGYFYVNDYRSTGNDRGGLFVLSADGTVLWDSLSASRTHLGDGAANDLLRATGGGAVSPNGDYVAVINLETNAITVLPLVDGLPDIANRLVFHGFGIATAQGRDVAFDAAGNLYAISSAAQAMRVFSPGGSSTAITGSDGTFRVERPTTGVSVVATDPVASEDAGDTAVFTITRTGDLSGDLNVSYTLTGSALAGTDYNTDPLSVTIPAGFPSADVVISAVDDSIAELPETITLTLTGTATYNVSTPAVAVAVIADNEVPVVTVSLVDSNAYEAFANDRIIFEIRRLGTTNSELFIEFNTTAGTATQDIDYSAAGGFFPFSFRLAPGELSLSVPVEPFDDNVYEGEETVALTILPGLDYTVGSPATAMATLRDDEWAPATVLFADGFDADSSASWIVRFGANDGVFDAISQFGYNYGDLGIPPAPHSPIPSTGGLFLNVNKDATPSSAGINLYPVGQSFSGNYVVRFDMYMSVGSTATTEHALAGINHSGLFTNRVSQTPANHASTVGSDGIWFGIESDAGNLRDYGVYTSTNAGSLPALIATRAASTVSSFVTRPPYAFAGAPSNASNSTTKAWSSVEIAQKGDVVSLRVNSALILQITNTYGFTSGNVMIGYNDQFDSRGADTTFVIFDNFQVVSTDILLSSVTLVGGNNVQIDFLAPPAVPSEFRVESTDSLSAVDWDDETGAQISERTDGPGFRAVVPANGPTRFYRIVR